MKDYIKQCLKHLYSIPKQYRKLKVAKWEWSDPDDGKVVITKVKEIHEAQVDAGDDNLTFIDLATHSSAGRARGCQGKWISSLNDWD